MKNNNKKTKKTNITNKRIQIEDAAFLKELKNMGFKIKGTDLICNGAVQKTKSLAVCNTNIQNLNGIEAFENLEELFCELNEKAQLRLETPNLQKLIVVGTSKLDFNSCTNLNALLIFESGIETIVFSPFPKLKSFSLAMSKVLSIDFKNNLNLKNLKIRNTATQFIDISANVKLEVLILQSVSIGSIDLSNNPNLVNFDLFGSKLKSIDVTANRKLEVIRIRNVDIDSIDISRNCHLNCLSLSNTNITSIDTSANKELLLLSLKNTKISMLDISKNKKLLQLNLLNTNVHSLDLSNNLFLEGIIFSRTKISQIDLLKNNRLKFLLADNTDLSNIDLSKNIQLLVVDVSNTKLKNTLDVSMNKKLLLLDIEKTNIEAVEKPMSSRKLSFIPPLVIQDGVNFEIKEELKQLFEEGEDFFIFDSDYILMLILQTIGDSNSEPPFLTKDDFFVGKGHLKDVLPSLTEEENAKFLKQFLNENTDFFFQLPGTDEVQKVEFVTVINPF